MAISIEMPKLSDTMTEGTLVKWHKQPGDTVEIGDVIAEIETDKATMEMEAFDDGVLLEIRVQEGEKAPIGTTLAILGEEGEEVAASAESPAQAPAPGPAAPARQPAATPATKPAADSQPEQPSGSARIKASPLARKVAAELGVDLAKIRGTGPAGRIVRADVETAAASPSTKPASRPAPAPESGAEEPALASSGIAQAAAGLMAAAKAKASAVLSELTHPEPAGTQPSVTPATAPTPAPSAPILPVAKEGDERIELTTLRRIIAERLLVSKQTIPHFYLHAEVDAGPLMTLRKQVNSQAAQTHGNKYTINDFILKATIEAVRHVPAVNASFAGDSIVRFARLGLAVAIAVDDGLVTPVVKDADTKSLLTISREVKDMAARAREGKLRPDEFDGGTITVSNLGAWGVESFDAIVNPPQALIVSVGAAMEKPVVRDGQVVPGLRMNLGVSCDHRVVDGAIAAQFLAELKKFVEQPELMLI